MRLDKFLKVSRIIKRRTVAKEASNAGIIKINEKIAKASSEVKEGDIIEINYPHSSIRVRVVSIQSSTRKQDAANMYEVISK